MTTAKERDPAVRELEAEVADLRRRFRHIHLQAEDLKDTACRRCGLDMRNPIHVHSAAGDGGSP